MNHIIQAKKSNMKRPLDDIGKGNAKKSKTFHPSQEEPSTSGIEINLMTPVIQGKGSVWVKRGRGQCRGSTQRRGISRGTNIERG